MVNQIQSPQEHISKHGREEARYLATFIVPSRCASCKCGISG
jgi:hypothetical protein